MDIFTQIQEATTKQLQRKQKSITRLFPTFPDRVKAVADNGGIRLESVEDELWKFKVHSGTQKDVWYDVYLKFKNILSTLEKLVKDRRLWVSDKSRVDRTKLARKFMNVVDVELKCSCMAFTYWGPAYILSLGKYQAKFTDDEKRPPRIRNPRQYGAYCKHLENLMKVLPFYNDTAMKWLEDFYSEDIERFEEEAIEELGFVKKAAKALGKRKEEEETRESRILEALTKVEREVKQKYKKRIGKRLTPAKQTGYNDPDEVGWLKFWLLKDGTIIPIKELHLEIIDSEDKLYWYNLVHSGALVGYLNGPELGFLQGRKNLTSSQIFKLKQLYLEYHPDILYVDSRVIEPFRSRIDSLDHLEYLLKYGKMEESVEEVHELSSCMLWAEKKTKELLNKRREDFKVIEGYVFFGGDEDNRSEHTWIEFSDGTKIDDTIDQFEHWGFSRDFVDYLPYDRKEYTPQEYLDLCRRYLVKEGNK